jgi:hypothetical protein
LLESLVGFLPSDGRIYSQGCTHPSQDDWMWEEWPPFAGGGTRPSWPILIESGVTCRHGVAPLIFWTTGKDGRSTLAAGLLGRLSPTSLAACLASTVWASRRPADPELCGETFIGTAHVSHAAAC